MRIELKHEYRKNMDKFKRLWEMNRIEFKKRHPVKSWIEYVTVRNTSYFEMRLERAEKRDSRLNKLRKYHQKCLRQRDWVVEYHSTNKSKPILPKQPEIKEKGEEVKVKVEVEEEEEEEEEEKSEIEK